MAPACVVAAVLRGARVLTGSPEFVLEAGDRVLCVTDVAQIELLHPSSVRVGLSGGAPPTAPATEDGSAIQAAAAWSTFEDGYIQAFRPAPARRRRA